VGAGKMGMAMVEGWLAQGLDAKTLTLVDPMPAEATVNFANQQNISLLSEFPSFKAEIVVLAVKPQIAQSVMAGIAGQLSGDCLILSVIAGFSLEALKNALGSDKIIRTMPNTPAQVGKGVVGAIAGSGVGEKERQLAHALLSASGIAVWLDDEKLIDALTGISGCGPAYVFLLVEAMAAAGVAEGLDRDMANILARHTVIGAAALMEADSSEAAILRKNVTSPNGVTAEALKVLMDGQELFELVGRAVKAAARRNREIGE